MPIGHILILGTCMVQHKGGWTWLVGPGRRPLPGSEQHHPETFHAPVPAVWSRELGAGQSGLRRSIYAAPFSALTLHPFGIQRHPAWVAGRCPLHSQNDY